MIGSFNPDITKTDIVGRNALHIASIYQNLDAIKYVIELAEQTFQKEGENGESVPD